MFVNELLEDDVEGVDVLEDGVVEVRKVHVDDVVSDFEDDVLNLDGLGG